MSDQAFNEFGDRVIAGRDGVGVRAAPRNPSQFLARFGITLFWTLVIVILSARVLVGV